MKRVVIVGGGVAGLFCAVRLAKAGARVTLLEAESEHASVHGPMASAAAAGMLALMGDEPPAFAGLAAESFKSWRQWREGAAWADGVRFEGGVTLAASEAQAQARARRVRGTALSPAQVEKRTGLRARAHGVFVEDEGVADPLRVLSGLAIEARAHGVLVRHKQDVASVTAHSAATHEGETFEADALVLCPGAWATDALKAAAPALAHIRPGKGHLVSVAMAHPLPPNLHAPNFYLTQRREDAVLGSTMELDRFDRHVDRARVDALLAAARAMFPGQIEQAGRAWAGIRPMSPDGWPMAGPTGEGVLIAAGHSRNGWLLAPVTAEIITARVFGLPLPPTWAALAPDRFAGEQKS